LIKIPMLCEQFYKNKRKIQLFWDTNLLEYYNKFAILHSEYQHCIKL
jgi:hypothetical protein